MSRYHSSRASTSCCPSHRACANCYGRYYEAKCGETARRCCYHYNTTRESSQCAYSCRKSCYFSPSKYGYFKQQSLCIPRCFFQCHQHCRSSDDPQRSSASHHSSHQCTQASGHLHTARPTRHKGHHSTTSQERRHPASRLPVL